MTSISNLFNHFMSLVGLNHYNKSESDNKYATKAHNHSEYLTSHQDITGKVDKAQGSSNKNKNVVTDSNGTITTEAKPVIPTKTSDLTNDSNYVTTSDSRLTDARTPKTHTHGNISNDGKIGSDSGKIITTGSNGVLTASSSITKSLISDFPTSMTPTSHSHGSLANGGTLNSDISSVNKIAVTDSSNNLKTISQLPYSKISGTPTIPTKTSDLTNNSGFLTSHNPVDDSLSSTSTNAVQNKVINTALNGKANSSHEHSSGDVKDSSAYSNIGSSANATQKTINDKINTAIGLKANSSNVYTKSETYTQSEITTAISNAVSNLQLFEVVSSLPASNIKTNRLYLMVNGETIANNSYDIYLRVNNSWEQLDSLEFDISNFYNKTEIDTLLDGKVSTSDSRLTDSRTPKSHSHGNITNTGTLSGKGQNVVTDSNGAITTEAKPTIPTKTSDLTNDSGFLTSHNPIDSSLSSTSTNAVQNKVINTALNGKANSSHTHHIDDLYTKYLGIQPIYDDGGNGDVYLFDRIKYDSYDIYYIDSNNDDISFEDFAIQDDIPTKTSDLTNDNGFLTAHQDISGKEDTSNKVKSVSSLSSSSTDDQYASAKLIYNTLIKSDSTTKNGHTHNYTTSSDVDTKVSTHNSSNSAHSDIRNAIPSDISDLTDSGGVIPTDTSDLTNGAGFLTSHNPVDDSLSSTSTNALQNKVINTALNGKENISNKSSNITTDTGSTTKYPTVQAVENYVNSKVDASFNVEVIQNYSVQDLEDDYAGNDGNAFGMYIDDEGLNYDANTIYLLYNDDLVYGRGSYYNEYILINDTGQYPVFELLGTTQMDLSGLLTKSEADTFYQPLGNYLTSLPSHNHNDLYYTESEVNSLLNSKLNTSDFATQLEAVIDSLITEAQS